MESSAARTCIVLQALRCKSVGQARTRNVGKWSTLVQLWLSWVTGSVQARCISQGITLMATN